MIRSTISVAFIFFSSLPVIGQQFNNGLLVPSVEKVRKVAIARPKPAGVTPLRPVIDLSVFLPTAGMQGHTQGSCAAWAMCYGMMTALKVRQMRWPLFSQNSRLILNHIYSPAFLYNSIKTDVNCARGLDMIDALDFCVNKGSLFLSEFPYDPDRCERMPNTFEQRRAESNRLLSYNKVFDVFSAPGTTIDIEDVKSRLNDSLVLTIGVHLDPSFRNNTYGNRSGGPESRFIWDSFNPDCGVFAANCYHAMLCVGYDDAVQAFKVLNSWDRSFGNDGYIWISYNVFRQAIKEAYIATLRPARASIAAATSPITTELIAGNNIFERLIVDTNWIKKGYYREYKNLRVGCQYINKRTQSAIIRLSDSKDNTTITSVELQVGDSYSVFEYLGNEIKIRLLKIGNAGKNPFTKAVFYEVIYKNISDSSSF